MLEEMIRAVAAALACGLLAAAPARAALPRATADRPDDVVGPQIHFVYALPSDGADAALDARGNIEGSVRVFLGWLAQQTDGETLRVDTAGGQLDVSFIRLRFTDAELAAFGQYLFEPIVAKLNLEGLDDPEKIYDVYYDGTNTYACGAAAWPPTAAGHFAVMYLRGVPNCGNFRVPAGGNDFGYWEFAMLHDTLHALGIVPLCAPHVTRSGHVSDYAADLMYGGGEGGPISFPVSLDIGRDDYWHAGIPGCPGLEASPFLTRLPALGPVTYRRVLPRPSILVQSTAAIAGERVSAGRLSCAARLAGKRVTAAAAFARGVASCRYRLARSAIGKRLAGSLSLAAGGVLTTKAFAYRIR